MSENVKLILTASCSFLIVLLVGAGLYLYFPFYVLAEAQNEHDELQSEVNRLEQLRDEIDGLEEQLSDLQRQERTFRRILPTEGDNPPHVFTNHLDNLTARYNLEAEAYSPNPEPEEELLNLPSNVKHVEIGINSITGDIFDLFSFIWALENEERLIRVRSFSVSNLIEVPLQDPEELPEGEEPETTLEAEMDIVIDVLYYAPPGE